MKKNILDGLNEPQREAVTAIDGPVMVIAGAGSGKTRVLTHRVAYLLEQGVDAFNILALTFTNKAAREMKERIINLISSSEGKNVWMGTFHSIFARVLRAESEKLGYPNNFTIYDNDDSKRLISTIVKELNLDKKTYKPNVVLHRISSAKSNLLSPADYNNNAELMQQDKFANRPETGRIYTIYNKRLFTAQAMDFDDLLYNMNVLLRDFPDALHKYQKRFRYILVDEYQDTNFAQYLIVKKLAADNENICVVGDDAQSIYAFRGANIQNILNFQKDYPDLQTVKLEQNYRSTKVIVQAANSVIKHNKEQIFKEVWTQNDEGDKIQLIKAATDNEEGVKVAGSIFEIKMNDHAPNDAFAILYRTNAQSRSLEEALRKQNIPYRIYGGLSFYKRKEIKDLLAYFRLVINQKDEDALRRIINYPARGIGNTTLDRLTIAADKAEVSLWDVLVNPMAYNVAINSTAAGKVMAFANMIRSFSAQLKTRPAFDLAKAIAYTSGIWRSLDQDKSPEGVSRLENIEELLNAIKDFTETDEVQLGDEESDQSIRTLDQFMQDIALLTDADEKDEDPNKVSLMTIHAAKGLEFPYVYVVGLEENLFPSAQSLTVRADLEEERRLFYVAVTRAEKRLFLTYADNRYRWGNLTFCEPSRFLEEINPDFIESAQKAKVPVKNSFSTDGVMPKLKFKADQSKLKKIEPKKGKEAVAASSEEIQAGMEVEHLRFGRGKVVNVEGSGANKKASVFFHGVGQKQLLLRFAKLKIVN